MSTATRILSWHKEQRVCAGVVVTRTHEAVHVGVLVRQAESELRRGTAAQKICQGAKKNFLAKKFFLR